MIKIKRREKVSSSVAIPSVTAGGHAVPPPLAKGRLTKGTLSLRGRTSPFPCTKYRATSLALPSSFRRKVGGERTSQAFPWKGKGDHRRWLSETLKIQAKGEEFLAKSNLCRGWMRLTKSPKVKSFSLPVNPLRHGGRTRRATSPCYGEAALRASPIERAYKNRAVHDGQVALFPPRKGEGERTS